MRALILVVVGLFGCSGASSTALFNSGEQAANVDAGAGAGGALAGASSGGVAGDTTAGASSSGAAGAAAGTAGASAGASGSAGASQAGSGGTAAGAGGDAGAISTSGAGGASGSAGASGAAGASQCVQLERVCFGSLCDDLAQPLPQCWSDATCPHTSTCRAQRSSCPGWFDILVPAGWSAVIIGRHKLVTDCTATAGAQVEACSMVTATSTDLVRSVQGFSVDGNGMTPYPATDRDWGFKVYFAPAGTNVSFPSGCPKQPAPFSCAFPSDSILACRLDRPTTYLEAYPEP